MDGCSDAGDGISDANFEEDVADNSVLRLYVIRALLSRYMLIVFHRYNNKEWIEDIVNDPELRTGELNSFQDKLFNNELNTLVHESRKNYEDVSYENTVQVTSLLNRR